MQKLFMTYLMLQARLLAPNKDEKGQGTLEYVGMIIVAALIAAAVISAAKGVNLGAVFTDKVNSVING